MRLMQLSEYLALVATGASPIPASQQQLDAAIEAAQQVWPETGLAPWTAERRGVVATLGVAARHTILCQINAGPAGCVLIVAIDAASLIATSYILIDLGAEFATPVLRCPGLPYVGPVTQGAIAAGIPQLCGTEEGFLQIETGPGTFLQAHRDPDGHYHLKHQMVTPVNCYEADAALEPEAAMRTIRSYAFGHYEWASSVSWRRAGAAGA